MDIKESMLLEDLKCEVNRLNNKLSIYIKDILKIDLKMRIQFIDYFSSLGFKLTEGNQDSSVIKFQYNNISFILESSENKIINPFSRCQLSFNIIKEKKGDFPFGISIHVYDTLTAEYIKHNSYSYSASVYDIDYLKGRLFELEKSQNNWNDIIFEYRFHRYGSEYDIRRKYQTFEKLLSHNFN